MRLQPLVDALKEALLERKWCCMPVRCLAMLKPGNGKTHRAADSDVPLVGILWKFARINFLSGATLVTHL